MRAVIDAAIADGAKAVIVITDCETGWGDTPAVPVIIGANIAAAHVSTVYYPRPEWAATVRVVAQ